MALPGIGGVASLQTGGEHCAGVGACAAGYCCVEEFNIRVLGLEDLDHGIQTSSFTATRPPGEYFHLAAGGGRRRGCRGFGGGGGLPEQPGQPWVVRKQKAPEMQRVAYLPEQTTSSFLFPFS